MFKSNRSQTLFEIDCRSSENFQKQIRELGDERKFKKKQFNSTSKNKYKGEQKFPRQFSRSTFKSKEEIGGYCEIP